MTNTAKYRTQAWNITVVVATRNRAHQALNTLERLSSLPENPSVVVVVDGSDDATEALVRQRYPAVEVIAWAHRRGVTAARNAGVAAARTPYVAFSDDDSWWAPGALATLAETFDAYPNLGLAAGRILVGAEGRLDPTCVAMAESPLPSGRLPGPRILGFVACGCAVQRQAFLEVGGFPEEYVIGGEEEPLALALASHGWDLAYVDSAVAHHFPATRPSADPRDRRTIRNDLWSAWRYRRPLGAIEQTFSLIIRANTSAKRAGIRDALSTLPWILRKRQPVPVTVERARRRLASDHHAGPVPIIRCRATRGR